jgi:creatinine amidohydrolase
MMHLITRATTEDEHHRNASIAVLPVGSFEQHGRHLPLTTDTLVASAIAQRRRGVHDLAVAADHDFVFA